MRHLIRYLDILSLTWFIPPLEMTRPGANRAYQARRLLRMVGLPLLSIALFLFAWQAISAMAQVGSLRIPTPGMVFARAGEMGAEWSGERQRHRDHDALVVQAMGENPEMSAAELRAAMPFEARLTFVDQILTSLKTVFIGVGIAILIAVPIGIACGLSSHVYEMANPLIQVFKPISPLAWFPVVFIIVNSLIATDQRPASTDPSWSGWAMGLLDQPKSFIIAAVVVSLCAMWPTLINTASGVANVDRDYLNVAKVLNLGWFARIWRIVLPASLPHIFTGMRLSLGIGWMVLIAAEMMAVSPGIGGFIWNWYQSSNDIALSYLILSVIVIGIIGFILDRIMIALQKAVSHGNAAAIR